MATITINVTENGWIDIDVTDDAARILGAEYGTRQAHHLAVTVATALSRGSGLENLGTERVQRKRGINNRGWTKNFIDKRRRDEFIAARKEDNKAS